MVLDIIKIVTEARDFLVCVADLALNESLRQSLDPRSSCYTKYGVLVHAGRVNVPAKHFRSDFTEVHKSG